MGEQATANANATATATATATTAKYRDPSLRSG
jgi:hypothetical protein